MYKNKFIKLKDGRDLAYSEYGKCSGKPLLLFHGSPGSRILALANYSLLEKYNLRIIVPERPGFGLSTYIRHASISDWVGDVEQLVSHLQLKKFHLAGFSGGAPYVLACAINFLDRVNTITLISGLVPTATKGFTDGMSPGTRKSFFLFRYAPLVSKLLDLLSVTLIRNKPAMFLKMFQKQLCQWDKDVVNKMISEGCEKTFIQHIQEAYRQGAKPAHHDAVLLTGDWQLDLGKVSKKIHVWHGESDMLMPITPVRSFIKQLNQCECYFIPNAGHLLLNDHEITDRIFGTIVS